MTLFAFKYLFPLISLKYLFALLIIWYAGFANWCTYAWFWTYVFWHVCSFFPLCFLNFKNFFWFFWYLSCTFFQTFTVCFWEQLFIYINFFKVSICFADNKECRIRQLAYVRLPTFIGVCMILDIRILTRMLIFSPMF